MKPAFVRPSIRLARLTSLVLLAALGTILLMRFSPGYFADSREMDSQYANTAREALHRQQNQQNEVFALTRSLLNGWLQADFGRSRQYDLPVTELIEPRLRVTGRLLFFGVACGWLIAFALALPLSARRSKRGEAFIAGPTALLLSVPIGAMATACVVADKGGAATVLAAVIAVRDFKLVYRLFRGAGEAPELLFARTQGISPLRIACIHLLPPLTGKLLALALLSFVTALSSIVPLEVIFDVPGLGHLAWSAAMNRDLPVLLDVTLLMAAAVGIASMVSEPVQRERLA